MCRTADENSARVARLIGYDVTKPTSVLIPNSPMNFPHQCGVHSRRGSDIGAADMARLIIAAVLAVAFGPGSAIAQVGTMGGAPTPSPLGMTSPLGIGAPPPVAPTGIPLGATEIVPPGTSSGTTPSGLSTNDLAVCSGFGSSIPQASFGAPATGAASLSAYPPPHLSTGSGRGLAGQTVTPARRPV